MRLSKHQSIDKSVVLLFPLISWGRRGRDRMVVGLQLPLQSVHITTKVMTSNAVHDEVYSIQHYVIKFVSDLRQVGGFLRVLRFRPPITRMTTFASRRIVYIFCIKFKIIMQGSLQLRFLPGYVRIGLLLT